MKTPSPPAQSCARIGSVLLAGWLAAALAGGRWETAATAALEPPPPPRIAPLIGTHYPNDADGDHLEDQLMARLQAARQTATQAAAVQSAQNQLDAPVEVELIFRAPVTQGQIDAFLALGGELTHLYKAVSYGWNGRLPLRSIAALPARMGDSLVLVEEARRSELHLDLATKSGRVRPVWAPGFAGGPAGFAGAPDITIAVVDSGIDSTHPDLAGRGVYWQDYSTDDTTNPVDISQHGTFVSSVALGTGTASGSGTGPLYGTLYGTLSGVYSNNFLVTPMNLPTNPLTFTATARWNGGGQGTLELFAHKIGTKTGYTMVGSGLPGTSPVSLTLNLTGNPTNEYSPALISNGSMTDYVLTYEVSPYPGVDNFNRQRGVAPACNWAAAKVFATNGNSLVTWTTAALDDLVANRVADNIKVINLSLGVTGSPGISASERQVVNTVVNNGMVVTVSAGNNGTFTPGSSAAVSDPGRAAMALTVAAANDVNQLTDYSSQGFGAPGSVPGQEEDYKPDLLAPGGSSYYSDVLAADSNSGDGPAFPDQQANDYWSIQGTSVSAPFAAGCAALVIDALEQNGLAWDFNSAQSALLVKMLLCATASETATNREGGLYNPYLQRAANGTNGFPAGKDQFEGYGMINPDAAVEAVQQHLAFGVTNSFTLGPGSYDPRVWACQVTLPAGVPFNASLRVPATGDFDLYLYRGTPGSYGNPVILAASTQAGLGVNEAINYDTTSNLTAYLVVKRVFGSGSFSLSGNVPPQVNFAATPERGVAPLTVTFTNLTIGAGACRWDFGDGNTSTNAKPVNTFASPGNYNVTLAVMNALGTNALTQNNYIAVASLPALLTPAADPASFSFSFPTSPGFNYVIQYTASLTDPAWQTLATQAGDGTLHEFSEPMSGLPQRFYRVVVE